MDEYNEHVIMELTRVFNYCWMTRRYRIFWHEQDIQSTVMQSSYNAGNRNSKTEHFLSLLNFDEDVFKSDCKKDFIIYILKEEDYKER